MKRPLLSSLFIVLLSVLVAGQQVRTVRVGVTAEEYYLSVKPPNSTIHARSQRDLLVSYLNRHKPGMKSHVRVEAVALTTMDRSGIVREALNNGCDYIVQVYLSSFNPFPENAVDPRWSYSAAEQHEGPTGVSYFIQDIGDSTLALSSAGFSGTWRQQAAMSVMSSVYDAIVKAATP